MTKKMEYDEKEALERIMNQFGMNACDAKKILDETNRQIDIAKQEVKGEVENLRLELTGLVDGYSSICDRLWKISHKK